MRMQTKRWLTALLAFCICLSMLCFAPLRAHAATEIKNATTTVEYGDPVAMMEVAQNAVRASGTGYHLVSASWIDGNGNVETSTFKRGTYRLVIQLAADENYVFAENAQGYINNSNAGITTERSGDGSALTISRTYNTTVWTPVPVKHPGAETVEEGGWCSFVVSGMYVGSYEWVLESPEGETVPASRLADRFSKLRLEGDGTSKLKLYNIPYEMNGWKVYCTEWSVDKLSFTNTNSATLTVTTNNPPPSPTPEPTVEPTPEAAEAANSEKPEDEDKAADGEAEPPEEPQPTEHVHQFSESWASDELYHWHLCQGCDEVDGKAPHNMEWTETLAPTWETPGEEEGQCSVCEYRSVRETPIDQEAAAQREQNIFRMILFGLMAILLLSILILLIQAIRRISQRRY